MQASELSELPFDVVAAGETDRGCKRTQNEDALLIRADLGLHIVADGAGGHSSGHVASAIATAAIARHFDTTEPIHAGKPEIDAFGLWTAARRLSGAVQEANRAVIEVARSSNNFRGMGTTVVCALLAAETGRLHLAHVGDSRCYRLRRGRIEQLTYDHSILNDVVELHPGLADAALAKLPRHAVTRALGIDESVRVCVRTHRVDVGDRYLLCSDGVTNELGESLLENLLGQKSAPTEVVKELVETAKDRGGRDNVTVLVIDCNRPPPGAQRRPSRMMQAVRRPSSDPAIEVSGETFEEDDPEIVVVRQPSQFPREGSLPEITAVPAEGMDDDMVRALDFAIGSAMVECSKCKAEIEDVAAICPKCGHLQGRPLRSP